MMFGHELIESLHFIAPHRPCVQMDENLLFIGCGLAKGGDFFLFHVRQHKKLRPACPAKSFNAFPFSGFPLPKNAPYRHAKDQIVAMYGKTDNVQMSSEGETWIYHLNMGEAFIPFNFGYRPKIRIINFDKEGKVAHWSYSK